MAVHAVYTYLVCFDVETCELAQDFLINESGPHPEVDFTFFKPVPKDCNSAAEVERWCLENWGSHKNAGPAFDSEMYVDGSIHYTVESTIPPTQILKDICATLKDIGDTSFHAFFIREDKAIAGEVYYSHAYEAVKCDEFTIGINAYESIHTMLFGYPPEGV